MSEHALPSSSSSSSPRRENAILFALWLMVFASAGQVMIVAPILPRIGEQLAIPPALHGTLITGFSLALSIFAVLIGPISDRFGRRPVLLAGTSAMTIALLLHPLAYDYTSMLTVRIVAGASAGLLTGSAISYVGDYFPYHRRGWASGWVMSGFAVGQVLGVPFGTVLADRFGFEAAFLLFAVVMAAAFVLILVVVPQPAVPRSERLSIGSALASYAALLRRGPVIGASLAYATMFFSIWAFTVYFPTWAEHSLGMDADGIALLFVVGGIGSVLASPRAGKLSDRFGRKPLIIASCIGTAVTMLLFTYVVHSPWAAYGFFFFTMVLIAMRLPPFQALLTALVDDRQRGSLMSLVVSIGNLGGGLGAAIAGFIYADSGFFGCTIVAAVSILVTALLAVTHIPEPAHTAPA
ncbi:MAG: MFS transporter [Myxococcota bacterium]